LKKSEFSQIFHIFASQEYNITIKVMSKEANDIILKNVNLLSKLTEQEVKMMPATEAPLPSIEQVERIVNLVKDIIFPDYMGKRQSDESIRSYHIGECVVELNRRLIKQIAHGLQFCEDCEAISTKEKAYEEANRLALAFIDELPEIKRLLYTDVKAMFDNDPAAPNFGEVIFCYPVVNAMTHYRIAHKLHELKVPVIPRIITEQAHSKTGIDIHPGATIGEYFAIDHGTGVVIGETCIIGNHVTLYQGVTLGAKSFKYDENGNMLNVPRHPIIEDHVTVYSNASILGRITIGHHSVIGGNIWVTNDVPPYSRIQQSKAVDAAFNGGLGI
jgi:serine O-acetyltransferase